jgi:2-iminobutanoate/2-iminopropanoate deaminase
MPKEIIPTPDGAPGRMDGMVSGVKAGGFVFFSALRGRNPETNKSSDDTREQARQAFENLKTLMEGVGGTLDDVVKVTLYLSDLKYRMDFHAIWMEYFKDSPPARIALEVADASASPGGNSHFALDVIAYVG